MPLSKIYHDGQLYWWRNPACSARHRTATRSYQTASRMHVVISSTRTQQVETYKGILQRKTTTAVVTDIIMTWLSDTEYLCYQCSFCRNRNSALSSFITYHVTTVNQGYRDMNYGINWEVYTPYELWYQLRGIYSICRCCWTVAISKCLVHFRLICISNVDAYPWEIITLDFYHFIDIELVWYYNIIILI
jgi:hypothetical protein